MYSFSIFTQYEYEDVYKRQISMSELQDALKATKDVRNELNVYALNEKKLNIKKDGKFM